MQEASLDVTQVDRAMAYDSGLPSPMRTLVRNAVIPKLQPLTRAGGGWLEAVIPIGFSIRGPHDELGIDLLWNELGGRTPAIAVATTSLKPDDGGAPDTSRGHLTFEGLRDDARCR